MNCVGIDVFVHTQGLPKVPESVAGYKLTVISNRGTKVWPGEMPRIHLTDVFRCRYRGTASPVELLKAIEAAGFNWVHVEKLHEIGGKELFAKAQGE